MGALLALLLPLLPSLIQGVEKIFTKPSSGPDRMDAVLQAIRQILAKLQTTGTLPDGTPVPKDPVTDDALRGMIEVVLQNLKVSGQLLAPVVAGDLYVLRGTVTAIK